MGMNKTAVALALVIACLTTNALADGLLVTHDAFDDTVTIADEHVSVAIYNVFNPLRLYPQPQAVFKDGKLQEFRLRVLHRQAGGKPRYEECQDLKMLVDDKPFPVGFAYHHEPARMDTDEIWIAKMTTEMAATLGAAKAVRLRVCHDELPPFEDEDIESLAEWKAAVDTAVASGKLPSLTDD
jgi:hypothetical protein